MNQIVEKQHIIAQQNLHMQPEVVQEEVKDDPAAAMDDESAATEVADGANDGKPSDDEWKAIIETLWVEYD